MAACRVMVAVNSATSIKGEGNFTFDAIGSKLRIGQNSSTTGFYSSIGGGINNSNYAPCSVIAGGNANCIPALTSYLYRSTISGGSSNIICQTSTNPGHESTIGGGTLNCIRSAPNSTVGGGRSNKVTGSGSTTCANTIGGGSTNTIGNSCCGVIGGGYNNQVGTACFVFIGGGASNCIDRACCSGILAGCGNKICVGHHKSFIVGNNIVSCTTCTTYVNNLRVNGTLSKSGGSFSINHPDPAKTKTHRLVHGFVESATAGDNIYRFVVEVKDLKATINLPDYYKHLNEDDQVWVNSKNHFGRAYGKVNLEQTKLTVFADKDGFYNVLLIGTRKDDYVKKYWKGAEVLKSPSELEADKTEES